MRKLVGVELSLGFSICLISVVPDVVGPRVPSLCSQTPMDMECGCRRVNVSVGFLFNNDHRINVVRRAAEQSLSIANIQEPITIDPIVNVVNLSDSYTVSNTICSNLDKLTFALIGMTDLGSYETVQSYTTALTVPYIASSGYRRCREESFRYDILMNPSYIPAVLDFVAHYKWRRLVYLYNSDEGFLKLLDMYDVVAENEDYQFNIIARRFPDFNISYDILHDVDKIGDCCEEKVFFIEMKTKADITLVMKQIVDVGMNREKYHYIIGDLEIDTYDFSIFQHGGAKIIGFKVVDDNDRDYERYVEKWNKCNKDKENCPPPPLSVEGTLISDGIALLTKTLQLLWNNTATHDEVFNSRRCEFYNTDDTKGVKCDSRPLMPFTRGPMLLRKLKQTTLKGLTGHVSFDKYGRRTNYTLFIHSLEYKTPLRQIGVWSSQQGLQIPDKPPPPTPPANNNTIIITAVIGEKPFVMLKDRTDRNGEKYEGFLIDLLKLLQDIVKFDYVIVPRPANDSSYGKPLDPENNSNWTGILGELVAWRADLALAPMTILEDRQKAVSFTKPFMKTGLSIMIKRPDKRKPGMFSFKDPLATEVWVCILLGFLSVSVIIFLIGRFSPFEWKDNSEEGPSDDFSFLNSCWSALGALMQQGSEIFPKSLSGRCAESAWWFFTLILISSYTANLAAYLTVEGLDIPIDSVDQLAQQSEIKYGIVKSGSSEDFFTKSNYPVYRKMWREMINYYPDVNVEKPSEGWEDVKRMKGKYAFILEGAMNDYYNQRKPCTTMRVGKLINRINYGIATRKNLGINEELNLAVLQLKERGDIIKLRDKWWFQKGQCGENQEKSKTQSMSLSNVSGMFHILIGGLVVAMVSAVLEYCAHGRTKKMKYTVQNKFNAKKKKSSSTVGVNDIKDGDGESQPLNPKPPNCSNEPKQYHATTEVDLITLNGANSLPTGTLI